MTIRTYAVRTITDNHEPPRGEAWLTASRYDGEDCKASLTDAVYVLNNHGDLRDALRAFYIWDDGTDVVPLYVAGWSGDFVSIYLQPIQPRAEHVSNLRTWALGPRRCYHLKVQETVQQDDNV